MAREIRLHEMPASSQFSSDPLSTPPRRDDAPEANIEMPPREVIAEQAKEFERMTPSRPGTLQSGLMEFAFLWITPVPDELWRKMIATCIQWPPSLVDDWFHFRCSIAVRTAKEQRHPHPFRKQHDLTLVMVDGRAVELRCTALQNGEPWTDERFYKLVCGRYKLMEAQWGARCKRIEYETYQVREYRKCIARGEMDP
ncbi:hypothetical protein C8Q72DRAFT_860832 [Fomitopsis betulina]|nr:hypothetical protein C8Q72DRAFT_860832 [Fomitopsis betulina]